MLGFFFFGFGVLGFFVWLVVAGFFFQYKAVLTSSKGVYSKEKRGRATLPYVLVILG